VEMKEIRQRAKELMAGTCRLCPVCDGRACAGEVPGMGGAGTGGAFKANFNALAHYRLNMRVLHDAADPDLRKTLLGQDLALPVLAAPVAGVKFNMGEAMPEEDYILELLAGCVDSGIQGCFGDAVPDFIFQTGLKALRQLGGKAIPVVKPFDDEFLLPKLDQAAEAGASLVAMDVDAAGLITPRLMGRPVWPQKPERLRRIVEYTPLKFILKGIMTPDEAELAVEVGAAGIVVSNHGGRVMDDLPGTAEVLPAIVKAAAGRIAVLVDGGVRSGADVLKMLALGADAVLIGRPFAWATIGGGREGVGLYLKQIRDELISAMILTGCPDLAAVGPRILYNPPA